MKRQYFARWVTYEDSEGTEIGLAMSTDHNKWLGIYVSKNDGPSMHVMDIMSVDALALMTPEAFYNIIREPFLDGVEWDWVTVSKTLKGGDA